MIAFNSTSTYGVYLNDQVNIKLETWTFKECRKESSNKTEKETPNKSENDMLEKDEKDEKKGTEVTNASNDAKKAVVTQQKERKTLSLWMRCFLREEAAELMKIEPLVIDEVRNEKDSSVVLTIKPEFPINLFSIEVVISNAIGKKSHVMDCRQLTTEKLLALIDENEAHEKGEWLRKKEHADDDEPLEFVM